MMGNYRQKIIPLVIFAFLIAAVPFTVYFAVQKSQELRSKAAEGAAPTAPKIAGLVLPSVLGFQSDSFTGASTVSYPLSLPAGLGGLKPNLALSYSSSGIDDLRAGVENWELKYPAQASLAGLGWHLAGIDNITAGTDGRFFATIGGASYELVNEAYDPTGKPLTEKWHTNPESYIKIEHTIQNAYGWNNLNQWFVTAKDGTKYTFGSPLIPNGYTDEEDPATGYTIQDQTDPETPQNNVSKRIGYKWMVKHIEDTHGNIMDFSYDAEIETGINGVAGGIGCQGNYPPPENRQYVRSLIPTSIAWNNGLYQVFFIYEPRTDTDIDNPNPLCTKTQKYFSSKRLKEMEIKVRSQLLRKYAFEYVYAQNRPNHSLLTKITQYGTDGTTSLPSYAFEYNQSLVNSGNAVYLKTASNGYNGNVSYEYRLGGILFCNQRNECGAGPSSYQRLRVTKKTTQDGLGNNIVNNISYKEDSEVNIEGGLAFGNVINFSWPTSAPDVTPRPDQPPQVTNFEFLGHAWTKETLFEKNDPNKKVSVSKSYFHQRDNLDSNYFVDPRKGKVHTQEILDPNNEGTILAKTENRYDYNPKPTFNPVDGKMNRDFHPFVALYSVNNYLDNKHTRSEISYDNYGNQIITLEKGDVGETKDDKKSETSYLYNTNKWIINRPLLTKSFRLSQDSGNFVEFARVGYYYDNQSWNVPPIKGDVTMVDKVSLSPEEKHIQTRTEYDNSGNPTKVTDALGNETTTTYHDAPFNLFPKTITNAKRHTTTTDYDFLLGVPTIVRDVNGIETRFEYDKLGRATKIIKIGDNSAKPSIEYVFKDNDPVAKAPMVVGTKTRIESGADEIMEAYQFYNGLGQLIQEQSYGPDVGQIIISNTVYNSRGAVVEKPIPYYRNLAIGVYHNPEAALKTLTEYDALGRVIKVTNTDNTVASTSYNGFTKIVTNEANVNKVFENDAYGNLIKLSEFDEPGEFVPVKAYATTTYTYDYALGALINVKDTKNNITTISYDGFGQKTSMDDPDLGHWSYKYNLNGNLTEQTDNKNQTIKFEYDALNRVTKKIYPDSTLVKPHEVRYTYDAGSFGIGKRTRMDDDSGFSQTEYDNRGRIITETKTIKIPDPNIPGNTLDNIFVTRYAYDDLDRVKTITYPDGEQVAYSYNNRTGQPKGLSVGDQQIVTNTTYNALGQVKQQSYGNNTATEYKYYIGDDGQPASLRLKSINTSGTQAGSLFAKNYLYDPVGNITTITDRYNSNETENFKYDYLNRLTGTNPAFSNPYTASYSYNEIGNITTKVEGPDSRALTYNSERPVHAPKAVNNIPYQYDANGNLKKDELREITYDYENRPTSITVLGEATTPAPSPAVSPIPSPTVITTSPAPTITQINCDFDSDGAVTQDDIDRLKADYSAILSVSKPTDVNRDGYVNSLDYSLCISKLGT